jgi:hypothetical protein
VPKMRKNGWKETPLSGSGLSLLELDSPDSTPDLGLHFDHAPVNAPLDARDGRQLCRNFVRESESNSAESWQV